MIIYFSSWILVLRSFNCQINPPPLRDNDIEITGCRLCNAPESWFSSLSKRPPSKIWKIKEFFWVKIWVDIRSYRRKWKWSGGLLQSSIWGGWGPKSYLLRFVYYFNRKGSPFAYLPLKKGSFSTNFHNWPVIWMNRQKGIRLDIFMMPNKWNDTAKRCICSKYFN